MNSLRKWFYRPRKDDPSLMAQFYYADDELNMVAAELDSFDGRKDPERCTALVNQLRQCQDRVLNICVKMMDEEIPHERASRDFRVKFPDDVMQENLAGQLWFGAECLAAGSSIMNREAESSRMRPLAKAVTKTIETVRNLLREQCLKPVPEYTEKIRESLKIFDRLFAEFELSYVSAMVPVKSVEEHDVQQNVVVLFSETVQRALRLGLTTQDQIDDYDPALMFTIPRLAIVAGLVMFPDGPLNLDREPRNLSELFRPFRTLLSKIRELLWTMSPSELAALEKSLCSMEEPDQSSSQMATDESLPDSAYGHAAFTTDFVKKFYASYPSCKYLTPELSSLYMPGKKTERFERKRERTSGKSSSSRSRAKQERQSEKYLARLNATTEERPRAKRRSRRSHHRHHHNPPPPSSPGSDSAGEECRQRFHARTSSSSQRDYQHVPQPCPPTYDYHPNSRVGPHELCNPHNHRHSRQPRHSCHQPVTRIKTIACSCGAVGEYDREFSDESQDVSHQSHVPFQNSQASYRDHSSPCQIEVAHPHCNTASTNCDSACDTTFVNMQTDSRCGGESSSHFSGHGSESVEQSTSACNEKETSETLGNEAEDLVNATASVNLKENVPSGSHVCQACGTHESCFCDIQTNVENHGEGAALESATAVEQPHLEPKESHLDTSEQCASLESDNMCAQEMNICDVHDQPNNTSSSVVGPASPENRCSSSSTSPYNSGADDDEEVALALQAAEVAATWRARARFSDSQDLIHRLFVCISGVADQLQTNYASDLRKILKCVFLINQSPPEEPPKSEINEEPEWSATSPIHSYGDNDNTDNYSGGNDSERLSVESAEDALVVIGSPEHRHSGVSDHQQNEIHLNDSLHSSPHSSPPSSPSGDPPALSPYSSLSLNPLNTASTNSSSGVVLTPSVMHSSHTSPTEIPVPPPANTNSPSPPACPPSIQVPAAIFNDHALMQFTEVTQASIPPNVDLLSPPHIQYSESFGVIPEPYPRSSQDQFSPRDGVELSPSSSPLDRGSDSSRRRPRVQEPPAWIPDQDAPRCMSCGASFTMVRRRHHCRNCGKVFCAHCSQHAVPLPHFGIWKAVRVCNVCFLYYVTFTTETSTPSS
ncbi:lateral signaling target protein 2 homolog isoform X2 [Macrobrachium nipponense]|uniref:lateral signaling target protein 2 homolog isoform X1 n=1 Tax=Macrobrachium nipponense TaxID=159736 RepID=UPI0030C8BB13